MLGREKDYDEAEGNELFEDAVDDQKYNATSVEACYSVATISNSDEPLPLWRKLAYAAGGLPMQLTQNIISFFLPLFLLETAKITPYYLSAIQFAARVSDALTDPFVGFLVLRTKTRMGSKRPWIIFSTPVSVICFFLLFYTVPWHSEFGKFLFYMACVVVLQVGLTSFHVPYSSMVIVLSDVPEERDTLTAYRMFSEVAAVLLGVAVFGLIVAPYRVVNSCMDGDSVNRTVVAILTNATTPTTTTAATAAASSIGTDTNPQLHSFAAQMEINAYMVGAGATCVIFIIASLICFLGTKEKETFEEPLTAFFGVVRKILTYRPYLLLMGAFLFMSLGIQFVQGNLSLYITHSLKLSNYMIPGIMTLLATAIALLPVAQFLISRIGKKWTLAVGMLNMFPILLVSALLPIHPPLWAFFPVMAWAGFTIAIGFLLPWSMLPDVIDAFSLEHNMRQEAVFYSLYVFFNKFAVGLSLAFSAFVLGIVGYDKEKCSQPASVGLALRYLCGPGPVVFFVLALICLYFYPLSNARLSELRSKIMLRSNASTCNMLRSSVVNSEVDVNDPSLVLSPWSSARI
uniref:Sodium-dependent lysophosphatidylcholine symporter 1-B n=2 Tax=Diphyllobothriidae TaxID=28843 RepID=A0A0X3NPM6_SCHSO